MMTDMRLVWANLKDYSSPIGAHWGIAVHVSSIAANGVCHALKEHTIHSFVVSMAAITHPGPTVRAGDTGIAMAMATPQRDAA